jgi:hypothetical protein
MPTLISCLLLFLITLVTVPAGAETVDVDHVLERVVEAYGGEDNLRKLDRMTQEWDFVALMSNSHGTDVRSIKIPGQLKVTLTYPGKTEARILNGDSGHVIFDGVPVEIVQKMQLDAMRLQLMRLYSPLVLRDKIDTVTLTVEGEFCALTLVENGVTADYLVDQETWQIEKVVGTLRLGGREMQFRVEYSDFKFVDGVLVAHKENKFASSVNTANLVLRRIEFDAEFEEGHFQPPVTDSERSGSVGDSLR